MKTRFQKVIYFMAVLVLIGTINSCKKDEPTLADDTPALNPKAEVIELDNTSKNLIVQDSIIPNDFEKLYEVELVGFKKENIEKGKVIVDYRNGGNIWVVQNVKSGKADGNILINAVQGTLDMWFHNCKIEASTPSNRTKEASTNPKKLPSGKFKMSGGDGSYNFAIDYDNITIKDIVAENGISLSVVNNYLTASFTNFPIYSNSSNTFNVSVPNGKVALNNAIDLKMEFLPVQSVLLGGVGVLGSLKDFECSVYSDVDADLKLKFQSTTNGSLNLLQPVEVPIGSYTKIVPAPPLVFSVKVNLVAKLRFTTDADFNIIPHVELKNNYESNVSYKGLSTTPEIKMNFANVEKKLNASVEGDFNLTQRFEIVPQVEVYLYGTVGPSGEIICYEQFEANAHTNNALTTWDASLDVGMDYTASFDVSLLHVDRLSTSLYNQQGNLLNYNLYKAPLHLESVSGNNQNGTANTALPQAIALKVTDKLNNAIPLVPVFVETSNGSFANPYFYTNSSGEANINWTLGTGANQSAQAYLKDGQGNIIESSRIELNATTTSTGTAPVANFTASQTNVSTGTSVNFTDNSTNSPTAWSWTFAGGTPSSSTSQNPSVSYATAGTYDVTLTATNVNGSHTETKTGYITVTNTSGGGTAPTMVAVAGGTFTMGSPAGVGDADEHPQHQVTLSSFNISKYEITNAQYATFLNGINAQSDGSYNGTEYLYMNTTFCQIEYVGGQFTPKAGKGNYPVIFVTWYGAKAYAQWVGGRLPTEAEWEYAARGGNQSQGYTYSGSNTIDNVAWYRNNSANLNNNLDNYGRGTHPVGQKQANELGIHDMSGNVEEMCEDWYDANYYNSSPSHNPQGPLSPNLSLRVTRGGAFVQQPLKCRIAERSYTGLTSSYPGVGFRVVIP